MPTKKLPPFHESVIKQLEETMEIRRKAAEINEDVLKEAVTESVLLRMIQKTAIPKKHLKEVKKAVMEYGKKYYGIDFNHHEIGRTVVSLNVRIAEEEA